MLGSVIFGMGVVMLGLNTFAFFIPPAGVKKEAMMFNALLFAAAATCHYFGY